MSQRYTIRNRQYNLKNQSIRPSLKQGNLETGLSLGQVIEESPIISFQDVLRCQYFIYSNKNN